MASPGRAVRVRGAFARWLENDVKIRDRPGNACREATIGVSVGILSDALEHVHDIRCRFSSGDRSGHQPRVGRAAGGAVAGVDRA